MADSEFTAPEVTQLAEGLHRALSKLISMLRRGDPNGAAAGDLTLAQLSILVTLLDQGPIRMTDLAAHERVRTPTTTVAIRRLEDWTGETLARPVRLAGGVGRHHAARAGGSR